MVLPRFTPRNLSEQADDHDEQAHAEQAPGTTLDRRLTISVALDVEHPGARSDRQD